MFSDAYKLPRSPIKFSTVHIHFGWEFAPIGKLLFQFGDLSLEYVTLQSMEVDVRDWIEYSGQPPAD